MLPFEIVSFATMVQKVIQTIEEFIVTVAYEDIQKNLTLWDKLWILIVDIYNQREYLDPLDGNEVNWILVKLLGQYSSDILVARRFANLVVTLIPWVLF